MARKRRVLSDDEDYDGASSDASFEPNPPAKRANAAKKRKRIGPGTTPAEDDELPTATRPHPPSMHIIAQPRPLQEALLEWYAGVHESRGMPWRKPYNPAASPEERAQRAYEVWISEIMLQQTQVETVKPYYNKWMAKFPTIKDLAASDIETVNSLWKGLGYYSRAARLLSGAQKAVQKFAGRLPDNAQDMEAQIPGIGRYSAGAICSIAYGQCVPVLDGNVHRLLSRVLALHAPPKAKQTLDVLWRAAAALVAHARRPGDLNQALIELGATVCRVRDPACGACPLQPRCAAHQQQAAPEAAPGVPDIEELCTLCAPLPARARVAAFPMKAARRPPRAELDIVSVVEWRAGAQRWFLLVRRPPGGLLAGLHEFPAARAPLSADAAADAALAHLAHAPAGARRITPAGDVRHVFSHIRKTYRVQWVLLEGGGRAPPALADGAAWTPLAGVAAANVGTGVLKVWARVCALWGDDVGGAASEMRGPR